MEKIMINKKKSIGDVVFILEGKDTEFRLFVNILGMMQKRCFIRSTSFVLKVYKFVYNN